VAHRNIHYEAAFENYLRVKGWPYIAVDETKKAIFADVSLKSFDFVVYSSAGPNLLADVKGRKFPDTSRRRRGNIRAWENWITREDVAGLRQWQEVFGEGFLAVLVFVYWLQGPPQQAPFEDVHLFRRKHYAFMAMPLTQYVTAARPRSARWRTIAMPGKDFAEQAVDVAAFL